MATRKLFARGRLLRSGSEYAKKMEYLSNSIFGNERQPTSPRDHRVVTMLQRKPYQDRQEIVNYYPAHAQTTKLMTHLREYGLFRDEFKDFAEEMERLRKLRGKDKNFMAKFKDASSW